MNEVTNSPFSKLGLSDQACTALAGCGYESPTPIQEAAIPAALQGKDILGAAQTGSGKTAAFLLPLLAHLDKTERVGKLPRALVLAPTRELAAQIYLAAQRYRGSRPWVISLVVGGESSEIQRQELGQGCDLVIATPGRLIDAVLERQVDLSGIGFVVLDEADRMLELGFFNDTRKLLRACAFEHQTLLFSATLHHEVEVLAEHVLREPLRIEVASPGSLVASISESQVRVKPRLKHGMTQHLLESEEYTRALVFVNTRARAEQYSIYLSGAGVHCGALHGALKQVERKIALEAFREGRVPVLVATDLASRGLDIDAVDLVIHTEIPSDALDYVHRSGRSARMGAEGRSLLLVSDEEVPLVGEIAKLIGAMPQERIVDAFDEDAELSPLPQVKIPAKPERPKKRLSRGARAQRRDKQRRTNKARGGFKVKRRKK